MREHSLPEFPETSLVRNAVRIRSVAIIEPIIHVVDIVTIVVIVIVVVTVQCAAITVRRMRVIDERESHGFLPRKTQTMLRRSLMGLLMLLLVVMMML